MQKVKHAEALLHATQQRAVNLVLQKTPGFCLKKKRACNSQCFDECEF